MADEALHLLIPVDFSSADTYLLQLVARTKAKTALAVTLIHVHQTSLAAAAARIFQHDTNTAKDLAIQQLRTLSTHPDLAGTTVMTALVEPHRQGMAALLAEYALAYNCSFIVVCNKHRSRGEQIRQGSELMHIVQQSLVPVLVLSPCPVPAIKRLLFATDFSTEAVGVLLDLMPLLERFGAGLYCAKINTRDHFETTRDFRARTRAFMEEASTVTLEVMGTVDDFIQYTAEELATGVVNCAEDNLADLIVLATHGRSGLELLMNGSVTADVLQQTDLPVLIYKLGE